VLELRSATKNYSKSGQNVKAADNVSFLIKAGEFVVVHGPSGSGKSTLLLMLGGMLPPDNGSVLFEGQDIYHWRHSHRNSFRKKNVGFVFQRFFLVPYLTIFDNIRLRLILRGQRQQITPTIERLAERFRIKDRLNHRPGEISVGEQQRAAVARALAGDPAIILADEPTGNVDEENGKIITECLMDEANKGRAVVMVTHNKLFLDMSTKHFCITAGRVIKQGNAESDIHE
jgi:putative ABC transport system ATP-binding protein